MYKERGHLHTQVCFKCQMYKTCMCIKSACLMHYTDCGSWGRFSSEPGASFLDLLSSFLPCLTSFEERKEGRKEEEGRKEGSKEGSKEGCKQAKEGRASVKEGHEGRKEGGREGRKEEREGGREPPFLEFLQVLPSLTLFHHFLP